MRTKRTLALLFLGPLLLTSCLMSHQYRIIRNLDAQAGNRRFDPALFKAVDEYAMNAPEAAAATMESLAAYLARPEWGELERVRALWRWITSHIDYDAAKRNYYAPETFRDRKGTCQGYAELFVLLARSAGITAVEITGYCRGSGFKPGDRIRNDHAWNAVRIDSLWYLLDLTYGAGVVSDGKFIRQYQEHYFLTPPGEFIYSYLPEVPRWQLLPDRISKMKFEKLPFYRPGYFLSGLRQIDPAPSCIINCTGSMKISFSAPPGITLTAVIRTESGKSLFKPIIDRKGEVIGISADFREPGDYYLVGWAGPDSGKGKQSWAFSYLVKNR
ncbi:MAG: hypothetical protein KBC90_14685 [Spirochaetes bacterium]|nr:hypothetical protein [Spirochaetota bacterium]HPG52333.1 transglutaminase domain-containing protein [Spirochaetota bacterium]